MGERWIIRTMIYNEIMKKILLIPMLLTSLIIFSQEKMITKSGTIIFDASFPSFDEVKGTNSNVTFVLNPVTGEIASLALMKGFDFGIALMEEHFNENYIESDKFPKSVFKGVIGDLSKVDFTKDGKYLASVSGKLSMHGETKDVTAPVTFTVNNGMITATSEFKIMLEDYKILIPSLVKDKISKEVRVVIDINYEPLNH